MPKFSFIFTNVVVYLKCKWHSLTNKEGESMKTFVSEDQKLYWELFKNGPKGLKGNPLLITEFMEMENERKRNLEELSR